MIFNRIGYSCIQLVPLTLFYMQGRTQSKLLGGGLKGFIFYHTFLRLIVNWFDWVLFDWLRFFISLFFILHRLPWRKFKAWMHPPRVVHVLASPGVKTHIPPAGFPEDIRRRSAGCLPAADENIIHQRDILRIAHRCRLTSAADYPTFGLRVSPPDLGRR